MHLVRRAHGTPPGVPFSYPAFWVLLAAALSACAPPPAPRSDAGAQHAADVVRSMERARDAGRRRDYGEFVRHVRIADSLAPGHPALMLALARGYALAGDTAGARRSLERLVPLGLAADVALDSTYALVRGTPGFHALARRLAAGAAPVVRSDTAFLVPDPDLLPEAVAHDAADGSFHLGSLAKNRVVRVAPDGSASTFAEVGRPGRLIGLRVDPGRRLLWALTTARDSTAPRTYAGTGGRTALHRYDLRTGALTGRFPPREDGATPHLFNDLAVTRAGDVYVTDTPGNAVHRLRAGGGQLETFYSGDPRFHWPNGIALSPDESRLYVAHLEGIAAWDLATGRMRRLARPPGVPLADLDGLYACGDDLVAVQRMTDYEQVTRFRLAPSGDSVTAAEVLERRHPAYRDPTTGVVVDGTLYYIAGAQFGRLNDGVLVPTERPQRTAVLRLPLPEGCRSGGLR